jgi:hypothetical protein
MGEGSRSRSAPFSTKILYLLDISYSDMISAESYAEISARAQDMFSMSLEEMNFRNLVEHFSEVLRHVELHNRFPEGESYAWRKFQRKGLIICTPTRLGGRLSLTDSALAVLLEVETKEDVFSN